MNAEMQTSTEADESPLIRPPTPRPVETTSPGVLVHTTSDRRLAVEHWLLSTIPTPQGRAQARLHWREQGVAMLPLGGLISAVRIPAQLVHALTHTSEPADVDAFLEHALNGPVICALHGAHRYYALVPGSVPRSWHTAADEWRSVDVDCLGRDAYLGVPRVTVVDHNPATRDSYWSVPMASAGELCAPLSVARLIAAGRHAMTEPTELEGEGGTT